MKASVSYQQSRAKSRLAANKCVHFFTRPYQQLNKFFRWRLNFISLPAEPGDGAAEKSGRISATAQTNTRKKWWRNLVQRHPAVNSSLKIDNKVLAVILNRLFLP